MKWFVLLMQWFANLFKATHSGTGFHWSCGLGAKPGRMQLVWRCCVQDPSTCWPTAVWQMFFGEVRSARNTTHQKSSGESSAWVSCLRNKAIKHLMTALWKYHVFQDSVPNNGLSFGVLVKLFCGPWQAAELGNEKPRWAGCWFSCHLSLWYGNLHQQPLKPLFRQWVWSLLTPCDNTLTPFVKLSPGYSRLCENSDSCFKYRCQGPASVGCELTVCSLSSIEAEADARIPQVHCTEVWIKWARIVIPSWKAFIISSLAIAISCYITLN